MECRICSGKINKGEKIRVKAIKNLQLQVEQFNSYKPKNLYANISCIYYRNYCFFAYHFMNAIRILREYERGVIFRLGRLIEVVA